MLGSAVQYSSVQYSTVLVDRQEGYWMAVVNTSWPVVEKIQGVVVGVAHPSTSARTYIAEQGRVDAFLSIERKGSHTNDWQFTVGIEGKGGTREEMVVDRLIRLARMANKTEYRDGR